MFDPLALKSLNKNHSLAFETPSAPKPLGSAARCCARVPSSHSAAPSRLRPGMETVQTGWRFGLGNSDGFLEEIRMVAG